MSNEVDDYYLVLSRLMPYKRIDVAIEACKRMNRRLVIIGDGPDRARLEKMADDRNGYVFYFNSKYCLDAWKSKKSIAQFANDAKGLTRVDGIKNNSEYITEKKRCFIETIKDVPAGGEILVGYGAEYWQVIRYNVKLEQKNREKEGKKKIADELPHHKAAKRTKLHH